MILAVDIGNTSVSCGLFSDHELTRHWYFPTHATADSTLWTDAMVPNLPATMQLEGAVIGSVVPHLSSVALGAVKGRVDKILEVNVTTTLPIRIAYEPGNTPGIDRIANVIGARHLQHGAAVVVDIGTAVTIDCLSENDAFIGGAILPGPALQARSLHNYTSALPLVALTGDMSFPAASTEVAIRVGVLRGLAGGIIELADEAQKQLGGSAPILLTGGYATLFAPLLGTYKLEPHLTLIGLLQIYLHQNVANR